MISNYILNFILIPKEKDIPHPSSQKLPFYSKWKITQKNHIWTWHRDKQNVETLAPVGTPYHSFCICGSGNTAEEGDTKNAKAGIPGSPQWKSLIELPLSFPMNWVSQVEVINRYKNINWKVYVRVSSWQQIEFWQTYRFLGDKHQHVCDRPFTDLRVKTHSEHGQYFPNTWVPDWK